MLSDSAIFLLRNMQRDECLIPMWSQKRNARTLERRARESSARVLCRSSHTSHSHPNNAVLFGNSTTWEKTLNYTRSQKQRSYQVSWIPWGKSLRSTGLRSWSACEEKATFGIRDQTDTETTTPKNPQRPVPVTQHARVSGDCSRVSRTPGFSRSLIDSSSAFLKIAPRSAAAFAESLYVHSNLKTLKKRAHYVSHDHMPSITPPVLFIAHGGSPGCSCWHLLRSPSPQSAERGAAEKVGVQLTPC